jgi:hypothetical protein
LLLEFDNFFQLGVIFVHVLARIFDDSLELRILNVHALLDAILILSNNCFPEGFDKFGLFFGVDLHFEEFPEIELEFLNLFEAIVLSFFFEVIFCLLLLFHFFEQLFFFFKLAQIDIHEFI